MIICRKLIIIFLHKSKVRKISQKPSFWVLKNSCTPLPASVTQSFACPPRILHPTLVDTLWPLPYSEILFCALSSFEKIQFTPQIKTQISLKLNPEECIWCFKYRKWIYWNCFYDVWWLLHVNFMIMIIVMMMNCFCGMVDRWKALSLTYFQSGPLSGILTIANRRHVTSWVWTFTEPEFRLIWMKLRRSDNG